MACLIAKSKIASISPFLYIRKRKISKYIDAEIYNSAPPNYSSDSTSELIKRQIRKRFKAEKKYIDELWTQGHYKLANEKIVELYDFLDVVNAVELRMSYDGPHNTR